MAYEIVERAAMCGACKRVRATVLCRDGAELCMACHDERYESAVNTPEPPPAANGNPPLWPLVIADMGGRGDPAVNALVVADMADRDASGRIKYGCALTAHNGRNALVDAYQECLDLCVYLKQSLAEKYDGEVWASYEDALNMVIFLRKSLLRRASLPIVGQP